jgi:hypothetical protein
VYASGDAAHRSPPARAALAIARGSSERPPGAVAASTPGSAVVPAVGPAADPAADPAAGAARRHAAGARSPDDGAGPTHRAGLVERLFGTLRAGGRRLPALGRPVDGPATEPPIAPAPGPVEPRSPAPLVALAPRATRRATAAVTAERSSPRPGLPAATHDRTRAVAPDGAAHGAPLTGGTRPDAGPRASAPGAAPRADGFSAPMPAAPAAAVAGVGLSPAPRADPTASAVLARRAPATPTPAPITTTTAAGGTAAPAPHGSAGRRLDRSARSASPALTLARAPADGSSGGGGGGGGGGGDGGGGGGGGDGDQIMSEVMRRVREEQEQIGQLINHPF